ncbi:hypothetical protein ACROYT_G004380 [Oculina patagonica]
MLKSAKLSVSFNLEENQHHTLLAKLDFIYHKMDTKILLALTVLAVISCLQFTTVSGLPTAREELGSGAEETDGNQTDWTISPLRLLREKRQVCKSYSRAQLVRKLNKLGTKLGASSYGGYNRRYMAITWKEARKFPSLVTTVGASPLNASAIQLNLPYKPPSRVGTLTSRANCHTTDGGLLRMCSACPAVTFLGHDRIPKYINEVTCGQTMCSHGVIGMCQNAVMHQQFLYKTGRCDPRTGYEEVLPYTQAIRVCCECLVFPS